jgi:hypothetical protein
MNRLKLVLIDTLIAASLVITIIGLIGTMIYYIETHKGKPVVYDCKQSEISPDVPTYVKEYCRKQNARKI